MKLKPRPRLAIFPSSLLTNNHDYGFLRKPGDVGKRPRSLFRRYEPTGKGIMPLPVGFTDFLVLPLKLARRGWSKSYIPTGKARRNLHNQCENTLGFFISPGVEKKEPCRPIKPFWTALFWGRNEGAKNRWRPILSRKERSIEFRPCEKIETLRVIKANSLHRKLGRPKR